MFEDLEQNTTLNHIITKLNEVIEAVNNIELTLNGEESLKIERLERE